MMKKVFLLLSISLIVSMGLFVPVCQSRATYGFLTPVREHRNLTGFCLNCYHPCDRKFHTMELSGFICYVNADGWHHESFDFFKVTGVEGNHNPGSYFTRYNFPVESVSYLHVSLDYVEDGHHVRYIERSWTK